MIALTESLAGHGNIDLGGIADSNEALAKEVADKVGIENFTTDLMQLKLDAIASFVSVDMNPGIVIPAAKAGNHIISQTTGVNIGGTCQHRRCCT